MSGASTGGVNHPIVVAPLSSRLFSLPEGVALEEPGGESPGATHAMGFLAGGVVAGLKDSGRPDMGVLAVAPQWRSKATSACVFTTNAFAAAPVLVSRSECDLQHLVGVVLNSGNANACTGEPGLVVARSMQKACADELGVPAAQVAVASTGIIGVQLDSAIVTNGAVMAARGAKPDGGPEFNRSIMTTYRFPKICAVSVPTSGGVVRLGVCGKGAGMIAPAMATMLCVVTTDAELAPAEMQALLDKATDQSFNRITVDGEISTNDSVWFLASGASGVSPKGADLELIGRALEAMLTRVALMMVADGEGATKIMRLRVQGAENEADAVRVARAIADSPLVKTAMHGGDPNWGRIISSAGAAMATRSLPNAKLRLAGVLVVEKGAAHPVSLADRERMTAGVRQPEVDIELDLGLGGSSTEIFFADMGHEYITINAEYHT
jgi:glutamate N-acetyltransferase / amino-acid N-acetyltransferase